MIATTNSIESGTKMEAYEVLPCSPSSLVGLQQQSIYFSAINIFFSITAFLGNFLILVALNQENHLHPPSKLLYCCLATTDLLVSLVAQPLYATYWMSLFHEHWSLCSYTGDAVFMSGYALCSVSLLTLTAITVDRLLALLLGIRYRQIVTSKRTCVITAAFWILSVAAVTLDHYSNSLIAIWYAIIGILTCSMISIASYIKMFRTIRHHQAQVQDYVQQQPESSDLY